MRLLQGLTRMTFQPYSHKQLLEIINSRLEGTTAFAPEACMLAARKASYTKVSIAISLLLHELWLI